MAQAPILFFDSGLGGLSVLQAAKGSLLNYPFLYVADDKAFPYGNWSEKELADHILALFDRLIPRYKPVLTIIACNTASTLILEPLRQKYPKFLFVGTVPAIKPAALQTKTGLVSVLATKGTVTRAYTHSLIASYAQKCKVTLVGSNSLAQYAEALLQGFAVDKAKIVEEISPCFIKKGQKQTDHIVLACTHYPFLKKEFQALAPWAVTWLDPAPAIIQQAENLLLAKEPQLAEQDFSGNQVKGYALFTSNKVPLQKAKILERFGLRVREFA